MSFKPCSILNKARRPDYVPCHSSKLHNMIWRSPLSNVFMVKKPHTPEASEAMIALMKHLHQTYPAVNVMVLHDVAQELRQKMPYDDKLVIYEGSKEEIEAKADLIITLGGDGTILHAVNLFSSLSVPPVLSFSMGTLGFLLPFDISAYAPTFSMVYESRAKVLHRNRLSCEIVRRSDGNGVRIERSTTMAMNDISVHRGNQPNLTAVDIYVDDELFTTTIGDGIVAATPTGSTAYSLSAGGSIAHPAVKCIQLTPICPRSLSFRPLVLPISSRIKLQLSSRRNRNHRIKLAVDGMQHRDLEPGDHVVVESSEEGAIWCVAKTSTDWNKSINEMLGFNTGFAKL
ncbi:NADH kinase Pos5p, mitochondrial [Diutina catenulata]